METRGACVAGMTELTAGQILADRQAGGLVRALLLAALLGSPFLSGCSILSGGDDPGQPADSAEAEAAGEEAAPEFTPVSATVPADAEVGRVTIVYPEGNADLPDKVTAELDRLAGQLAQNDDIRVELHAYAKGDEDEASRAKLFALKRGMLVRSHLRKNGVGARQMVLRPLGIESGDGPQDRVDIVLLRGLDPELETRIASAVSTGQSDSAQPLVSAQPEPIPEGAGEASGDDEAARRARLAQLQQAEGGTTITPSITPESDQAVPRAAENDPGAVPEARAEAVGDPLEAPNADPVGVAVPDGAPVGIPQGDAPPDPETEGSLVARFEAIAAAEVQLAEDPDLRATIERKGGLLSGPDGSSEDAVPTELAQSAPASSSLVSPAPDTSDGEAAFVSRFQQPEGQSAPATATPAVPQFDTVPGTTAPDVALATDAAPDSAVSVASGAAFEAAMAGSAPPSPAAAEPAAVAPGSQLQSVVVSPQSQSQSPTGPSVAALPPAGTVTTDPAAPPAGNRDLYLIQFEPDSPDMTVGGRAMLRDALEEILSRPDTRVKIVAHADGRQDDEFLLALSAIRRNEVEGALRNSGVHWGRMWSKAVGDKKPSTVGADNNIVEIIIRQK